MSTPPDGLDPEYVQEVESIARGDGVQWPDTDSIGRDLMRAAAELEPGSSRLPEAVPPVLRPLAAAALRRGAIGIEQEMGGEPDAGSDEAADIERAERLAHQTLALAVRVDARRWSGGWGLYALSSTDLVTQVEDLGYAPAMIRDLLESNFPGADFSHVVFDVRVID